MVRLLVRKVKDQDEGKELNSVPEIDTNIINRKKDHTQYDSVLLPARKC
jgi:hypothetical protein